MNTHRYSYGGIWNNCWYEFQIGEKYSNLVLFSLTSLPSFENEVKFGNGDTTNWIRHRQGPPALYIDEAAGSDDEWDDECVHCGPKIDIFPKKIKEWKVGVFFLWSVATLGLAINGEKSADLASFDC
jgi:hypothetical protein